MSFFRCRCIWADPGLAKHLAPKLLDVFCGFIAHHVEEVIVSEHYAEVFFITYGLAGVEIGEHILFLLTRMHVSFPGSCH